MMKVNERKYARGGKQKLDGLNFKHNIFAHVYRRTTGKLTSMLQCILII